jgi:hypothetical protein
MILKRFWDEIIVPILKKDKNRVISNMNFPVTGHWTQMMKIDKKPNQATKEDFLKIYDSFFNDYFLKELTKMNYRNINKYIKNDTTLYQFGINRVLGSGDNAGGGSVLLIYYHSPSGFKLKSIQGAGGNFYYDLK